MVVCGIGKDLALNAGGVSQALYKKYGPALQDECKNKYPQGIQYGDVAVIKHSSLKTKAVFFVTMPTWADVEDKKQDTDKVSSRVHIRPSSSACQFHLLTFKYL